MTHTPRTRTHAAPAAEMARAQELVNHGAYPDASAICARLLKRHPKVAAIWGVLSAAQVGLGDTAEARRSAQKGLKLDPDSVDLRLRLGLTYIAEHRFDDAAGEFRKALALQPDRQWTIRCLCDALTRLGRHDEALALLRPHVEGRPWSPGLGLAYLKCCVATGRFEEGLKLAEPLIADTTMPSQPRTVMLFQVADCFAGAGMFDRAFEVYTLANECAGREFDPVRNRREVDRMIQAWTPEALAELDRPKRRTDRFVFIVGMPRSGTSLVEQIIASHPRAFGAGELDCINIIASRLAGSGDGPTYLHQLDRLTPRALDAGAKEYTEALRKVAPGAEIVTDKMPANTRHLGLIAAMLPQARIIHCVRDARDTCVSCYFHDFHGAGNAFAYDLENLGSRYTDYWRLMRHWKRTLDIPILDVEYEEMVADQEAQSRRLIEFVGLGWDGRCLDFFKTKRLVKTVSAEQVNKPMYRSSIGRWRRYERRLGPLLERLPAEALRQES
ncbi:MAG: sulfotransferase [Phycisphaeraceae bacterium]|nr:sulfotransferase [Phycisphaeraceae bacterium]MCB9846966.1 sulfotransferase [Phycisphaeraceae bacterium]